MEFIHNGIGLILPRNIICIQIFYVLIIFYLNFHRLVAVDSIWYSGK